MSTETNRWRPFVTAAVFSLLPVAVFLEANKSEAELTLGLAVIAALLLLAGVTIVGLVRRRRGRRSAERAGVLWAAGTFVAFRYATVADWAEQLGVDPVVPLYTIAAWLALFAAVMLVAWWLSGSSWVWQWTLAVGVGLVVISAVQYTTFRLGSESAAAAGKRDAIPAAASHAGEGGPDVYYFLLDGYGRADQLQRLFDYDNGPFLQELRDRGFDVEEGALSSYASTSLAQRSTLSLDYALTEGTAGAVRGTRQMVAGDNAVVASMKRLGYEYHFATDYDGLGCVGLEDICIGPEASGLQRIVGTTERTFLEGTPLSPLLESALDRGDWVTAVLAPDDAVAAAQRRRGDEPLFVSAHIMASHPPYRYPDECSNPTPFNGDEGDWGELDGPGGREYTNTIQCLNRELLRAVDLILQDDPNAIVILQGDHGPGHDIEFGDPVRAWSEQEVRQRYAVLNAARLPERCRDGGEATGSTVNTFAPVLECLTGEQVPLKPPRYFAAGYFDEPVSRLPPEVLGAARPPQSSAR